MTEEKKSNLLAETQQQLWKWVGALFLEQKTGSDGQSKQAASLTRLMTLIAFVALLVIWLYNKQEPPDSMLHTFWGLLGLKAADKAIVSRKPTP